MIALINFEILKFFKNKKMLFVLTFIISFLLTSVIYIVAPSHNKPSGFLMLSTLLSLIYPLLCFVSLFLGIVFFSQEYEEGTLGMILIGRFSREEFFIAKIISLLISIFLFVLGIFLSSIFAGLLFSHFKEIEIQGYVLKTLSSLWFDTFKLFLLLVFFLYSYSLLGFLLGIILKKLFLSILGSFLIYFLLLILSFLPKVKKFSFSYYLDLIINSFAKTTNGIYVSTSWTFYFPILINLFYIFIFIFSGIFLFKRMEI